MAACRDGKAQRTCSKLPNEFGSSPDTKQRLNLLIIASNQDSCNDLVRLFFFSIFLPPQYSPHMRNLTFISSWDSQIPSANVTATTFDLDENVIYAASEARNLDGEVEVELWKIDQSEGFNKPPVCLFSDRSYSVHLYNSAVAVCSTTSRKFSDNIIGEWTEYSADCCSAVHGGNQENMRYHAQWRRDRGTGGR